MRLARATNAIRTCQYLLLEEREEGFPELQRLRLNAFFYVGALLFEAFEFARSHSRRLKELDSFQERFVPLFRDDDLVGFISSPLKNLRNHGVFHFAGEPIPDALDSLDDDRVRFSIGEGSRAEKVYHFLADWAVLHASFEVPADPE